MSELKGTNYPAVGRARTLALKTTAALMAMTMATPAGLLAPTQALASDLDTYQSGNGSSRAPMKLGLNKSLVLNLPSDAYDILVANPTVADAVTRTARRIYLFGKQVGQTNIIVFGPNGEQIAYYDIEVERDVAGLESYIERFIPNSDIKVELLNDNVVLTGTVDTPLDATRAAQLAQIFVSGGEATTGQYSQTAAGGDAAGGVDIDNPDSARRTSRIVNLIQIIGEDQVTLKVTVAEVSRSVMKQLGINSFAGGGSDGIRWNAIGQGVLSETPLSAASVAYSSGSTSIGSFIRAMEQAGVMKTLAEPSLTAVSGEKATFRVGGEFNILGEIDGDEEGITKTYDKIEYGIGLEFQPTVLSPGRISLKIRTAVSEPTNESPGIVSPAQNVGVSLVSIRKRVADTTVELPSGGSMMIAGLVRDDVRQIVDGLPGLSKIPVLGTLFRSRDFIRNETELVILVTPYLTKPTSRNDLSKPDDNFNPPSDAAGMILGRVNRVYGTMKTNLPDGRYHGVVGYIYK